MKAIYILIFFSFFASVDNELMAIKTNRLDLNVPLKIAVYISPPLGMILGDSTYTGLSVEIWEEIAKELDVDYRYYPTDMEGLLVGLQEGKYDLAIGAITITPYREESVDFTHAVNPSGTGFAVAHASEKSAFLLFWKPILINLLQLLGILFIGIVISGFLIWLAESRFNPNFKHEKRIMGLGDSLWWAIVTMSTVGYGDKVPLSRIGKVIAIAWIFTSIILVALFTAKASSIFTVTKMEFEIKNEMDLRQSRVGVAIKSSGEEYCIRRNIQHFQYETVDEAIEDLIRGNLDAVVSNIPVIKYLKHQKYHNQIEICPRYLLHNNMGIALPPGSNLKEPINRVLLHQISEPNWKSVIEKYLGEI